MKMKGITNQQRTKDGTEWTQTKQATFYCTIRIYCIHNFLYISSKKRNYLQLIFVSTTSTPHTRIGILGLLK